MFDFGGNAIYAAWEKWFFWGGNLQGLYVFACRSARPTPFGDSIFRCTTKDRGERRAKGLRPLESPELMLTVMPDVLCAYVFATVRLTRLSRLRCREANTLGVRDAYPLASACCGA